MRKRPRDSRNTSLFIPERKAIVVQSVETKAEWLEGMLPVRQNMSSNSSLMPWTFPEKSFMKVFISWAQNQLKIQDRNTGFEKNCRNCSFALAIPLYFTLFGAFV